MLCVGAGVCECQHSDKSHILPVNLRKTTRRLANEQHCRLQTKNCQSFKTFVALRIPQSNKTLGNFLREKWRVSGEKSWSIPRKSDMNRLLRYPTEILYSVE